MASYGNRANVGYGRVTNPDEVRHPMFIDAEGGKHAVVGYAKAHNYVAMSEQVVEFRHSPGIRSMELYDGHGVRDKPILLPWGYPTHDQPHKDNEFSSRVNNHVGLGQNNRAGYDPSRGSPWNKDANELSRLPAVHDHSWGSPRSKDVSEPSRFAVHDHSKGSPWSRDANDPNRFAAHDHSKGSPRSRDASNPSRLAVHVQSKGSPWIEDAKDVNRFASPPSKDHYYYTHDSDDEDDVICEDGVCYVNKNGGSKPINHLKREDYDKEKHKGYDYSPKKDSYYNDDEKHKGNGYHVPPCSVPLTTQPIIDTYPKTNNMLNRPMVNSPLVSSPKPIKTRIGADFPTKDERNSPVSLGMHQLKYNGSPRKDDGFQETTYEKASPPARTIDCVKAAKMYNGVLLSN